jgi:phospholipid/cholesterol/gamma-HCH transport system ATP-binding protein
MMRPIVVLCDEPFSGLDPVSARRIEALLTRLNRDYGLTIIAVSHGIASTMRMAAQVLVLLEDEAVSGSPAELQASTDPRIAAFLDEDAGAMLDVEHDDVPRTAPAVP